MNDPGFEIGGGFRRGVNKKEAEIKREQLFDIIRDLVKWENTNNEEVLNQTGESEAGALLAVCRNWVNPFDSWRIIFILYASVKSGLRKLGPITN